ncbi:unnamed protein product [Blepharisma stoltei]|uniref:Uncharacterized protein n=1 Tax=Blepharisma stoltei TaxID=1481888 RepID=A0AAU9K9I4_9CILI|nr:unnamed protein product [Blepharisma stoltei]
MNDKVSQNQNRLQNRPISSSLYKSSTNNEEWDYKSSQSEFFAVDDVRAIQEAIRKKRKEILDAKKRIVYAEAQMVTEKQKSEQLETLLCNLRGEMRIIERGSNEAQEVDLREFEEEISRKNKEIEILNKRIEEGKAEYSKLKGSLQVMYEHYQEFVNESQKCKQKLEDEKRKLIEKVKEKEENEKLEMVEKKIELYREMMKTPKIESIKYKEELEKRENKVMELKKILEDLRSENTNILELLGEGQKKPSQEIESTSPLQSTFYGLADPSQDIKKTEEILPKNPASTFEKIAINSENGKKSEPIIQRPTNKIENAPIKLPSRPTKFAKPIPKAKNIKDELNDFFEEIKREH